MNHDAGDLREMFLHAVFESAGDVVDLRFGQASVHRAVAGHQDAVLPPDALGGQSTCGASVQKCPFRLANHEAERPLQKHVGSCFVEAARFLSGHRFPAVNHY